MLKIFNERGLLNQQVIYLTSEIVWDVGTYYNYCEVINGNLLYSSDWMGRINATGITVIDLTQ